MHYTLPQNLYGEEILLEFLNKYDLHIKRNGKIIHQTWQDNTVIARDYIGITNIEYVGLSADGAMIEVSYQTSDDEHIDFIEKVLPITISFHGGIFFDSSMLLNDLNTLIKDKKYINRLQSIYQKYFRECMKKWLSLNPGLLLQCGWFQENQRERGFKSITYRDSEAINVPYSQIDSLIFNGLLPEFNYTSPDDYCIQHDLHNFFDFLQNKHALFLFTCTIHALLTDYIPSQNFDNLYVPNTDTAFFSLCIHGKDISHVKTVGNLLLNVFDIQKRYWSVISRKIHISASSISANKVDALRMYSDVPIIFTTRKNRFYKSSGIIKKVHDKRKQGNLRIFPVYISNTPVIADEVINCCVDDIPTDFDLNELHSNMCFVLYLFIRCLSDIYRTKSLHTVEEYKTVEKMTSQTIERLHTTLMPDDFISLTENKLPEILLMSSLKSFCYVFSSTPLKQDTNALIKTFESYITNSEDTPIESDSGTVDYIALISDFIQESITTGKNEDWIFETTEKSVDGKKEICYCITTKTGFKHFLEFLKKRKIKAISSRFFTRILDSNGILKTLASSTAKCNKRRNKNVYMIKKEVLESVLA